MHSAESTRASGVSSTEVLDGVKLICALEWCVLKGE